MTVIKLCGLFPTMMHHSTVPEQRFTMRGPDGDVEISQGRAVRAKGQPTLRWYGQLDLPIRGGTMPPYVQVGPYDTADEAAEALHDEVLRMANVFANIIGREAAL